MDLKVKNIKVLILLKSWNKAIVSTINGFNEGLMFSKVNCENIYKSFLGWK